MTKSYHNPARRSISVLIKSLFKILPVVVAMASIVSCEEDPTTMGKGLLPGSDFVDIKAIDTLGIRSYTMYDASERTDNPSISYLGQISDPYFGTTTASFVSQLRLKYDWPGDVAFLDSMKLILSINKVQGATDAVNKLSFYEIDRQLYTDSTYYSNTPVAHTGFSMTDIVMPALRADTINNIEIKLPNVLFGERLLRDTAMLFHSNTKPDFRSYFKGLHFELNSGNSPSLLTLSLVNSQSTGYFIVDRYYNNFFVLYYHDIDGNKKSYYFILDAINKNAAFNKFSHNFATAETGKKIQHINDFYRDTLTYLQGLNGVYTRMVLPGLENLRKDPVFKNAAINKAKLTVPFYLDTTLYKKSSVPAQLGLRYRTKSGIKPLVPDYTMTGDTYHTFFNGRADTVNMVYVFNIPTFVQKYLEDTSGDLLPELEVIEGSTTKNIILKGNSSKKPVKLDLTYTIF